MRSGKESRQSIPIPGLSTLAGAGVAALIGLAGYGIRDGMPAGGEFASGLKRGGGRNILYRMLDPVGLLTPDLLCCETPFGQEETGGVQKQAVAKEVYHG